VKERVGIQPLDTALRPDLLSVRRAISADQFLFSFIPQQEMPVVAIKGIEVGMLARAFPGSAEGDLAQTSYFPEQIRNFFGSTGIDGELGIFCETSIYWKPFQIERQALPGNRRGDHLLAFLRQRQAERGGKAAMRSSSFGEQVGAPTQILRCVSVIANAGDRLGGDAATNPQCHIPALLLQEFLQEERQAHPSV
jgi:hypothetical protein